MDIREVEKLEKLAMVEVADKGKIARELSEIVEFVEILNQLDVSREPTTFSPLERTTPLGEDIPVRSKVIDKILENAPRREGNFFLVPQIIE